MSGEVQPRRRRDRKRKRAHLAKEEWEEGKALYGAEPEEDEEEVPEPVPEIDSSNSEEEDAPEEPEGNQGMTFKAIFFILLLALGAVVGLLFVEKSSGESDVGLEPAPIREPMSMSMPPPVMNEMTSEADDQQNEDDLDLNSPGSISDGEVSFLESIGSFIHEFLDVDPGGNDPSLEEPEVEAEAASLNPIEDTVEDDVAENIIEGISTQPEVDIEDKSDSSEIILEKATETSYLETQIEDPVDSSAPQLSEEWHFDPQITEAPEVQMTNEELPVSDDAKSNTQPDPISELADSSPPQALPPVDDFPNTKPDGGVTEDEIVVDEML